MARKLTVLILSLVLTIILFNIISLIQSKFINCEPMVKVLVANQNISANRQMDKKMVSERNVPLSLTTGIKVASNFEDIKNLYTQENMFKGELILKEKLASKDQVKVIEIESGKEKVSIKLESPENALSYQMKAGDNVNLYFTGKIDSLKSIGKPVYTAADTTSSDSFYNYLGTVKILENIKILAIVDNQGNIIKNNSKDEKPDTIIISVKTDEASLINNLKGQGTFDITGLPYNI
jgi:Flp pilus assembly protein CpaB